jgi:peptide/nickel transport system permease protein
MSSLTQAKPAKTIPRWRKKLGRNALAVVGFWLIGLFLFVAAFAPFISPYDPNSQNLRATYVPPFVGVSFSSPQGGLGLFVREVQRTPLGEVIIGETAYPVRLFVRGAEWSWWGGLLKSNLHLFGVDGGIQWYIFGADEQGRDVFSRLCYGAWISLCLSVCRLGWQVDFTADGWI